MTTSRALAWALAAVCAGSLNGFAGTFKHITIDGSFADWAGVPIAYTATEGPSSAIQYKDIYIANDSDFLYLRATLYTNRANAFANSYDNIFIDTDNDPTTGYGVAGIGSSLLIQWGSGYHEDTGQFNAGAIDGLGWSLAGSADGTDFEMAISLHATVAADSSAVFSAPTIAILMEGDDTSYTSVEYVPSSGGIAYDLASPPSALTTNLPLVTLTDSTWRVNPAGADLGANWLDPLYDDSGAGWASGNGLFGFSPNSAAYPPINTPLSSGPNTYYFRTHLNWIFDTANVGFVVTNYLSDGAAYYLNGAEVRRVRMPSGPVVYATSAGATNSTPGQPDVFGVDGTLLYYGDNVLEVETHQAANSAAEMVFGASLTAAAQYPVLVVDPTLPADQLSVLAGQSTTFGSDVLGSGPLTYVWLFNDTNAIPGANGPTYTIPLVLASSAGRYSLLVSNATSAATTRAATLTVSNIAVAISGQPVDQVAVEGRPATFTVAATGTPLIQYQWFFGPNPIPDATNASLTINSCTAADAGAYQVSVSNPAATKLSNPAQLIVLSDTLPPSVASIAASATAIVVVFSEPVNAVTASDATKYSLSGGVSVTAATPDPVNPAQVTLTTGASMGLTNIYTLTIDGVQDLFGNKAQTSVQFVRTITIDGSFDDWTGIDPLYSSPAPSGNAGAADFKDIYVANDANYYYFRVTLWGDIEASAGQFPDYANLFFDTDNNANTGYSFVGSEMLIQSGFSYQEKNGGFNDGVSVNGLDWLCLPAAPGTNFEFRISRAATFQDGTSVFTADQVNFMFQGQTSGWVAVNNAPPAGVISYVNATPIGIPALRGGKLAISVLPGGGSAVVWDSAGTLQSKPSLTSGSWTNVVNAVSPYVVPALGTQSYFRVAN